MYAWTSNVAAADGRGKCLGMLLIFQGNFSR